MGKSASETTFENSNWKRLSDAYGDLPSEANLSIDSMKAFQAVLGKRFNPVGVAATAATAAAGMETGLAVGALGGPLGLGVVVGGVAGVVGGFATTWSKPLPHRCNAGEATGLMELGWTLEVLVREQSDKQLHNGDPAEFADIRNQHRSLLPSVKARFESMLMAAALWSAPDTRSFMSNQRPFCFLMNFALDTDDSDLLEAALPVMRAFTKFCGMDRVFMNHLAPHTLPAPDGDGVRRTYRGGGMNEDFISFFTPGKDFRFPGFIASSFSRQKAKEFMMKATANNFAAVEWTLEIEDGCMHAVYLEGKYSVVGGEQELTLAPYSWCTVISVQWGAVGQPLVTNYDNPHRITLRVHKDNMLAPANLPLAPWR